MQIKITNIIQNKDGLGILDIDVTSELRILVRGHYKRKRCTKKLISRFINEGIQTIQLFRK